MGDPWDPSWQQTLGYVERSVAEGLAALDDYEARFAAVLGKPRPARPKPASPPPDAWDAKLAAARSAATEIDRLLADAEAGWARWSEAFSAWRRGLQQAPKEPPHDEGRGDPAGGG